MNNIKNIYCKNKEAFYLAFLFLACLLFIFANIGLYPLIDIDETRYVNMSKYMYLTHNYLTPILNFEPFLEKPPLYFWLNVLSFKFLNYNTVFAGRFATGLVSSFGIFYTYFFAKKISNNKLYGFLSANVLLTSAWFLTFSHIAILDMNFMVFSMSAIYSAILALFVNNEANKKYCWYLGYFFMALSILAKGFIGLAIPCMVVFFSYLCFKKVSELFKPTYIIPGLIIFIAIALPWHVLIYQTYKTDWINMYILKHHFARLLNSEDLGRKQPFLFYLPIMLIGLMPWMFDFILKIISDIKKFINHSKTVDNITNIFYPDTLGKKITTIAYVYLICTFLFFSAASTKLPPYILTAFPALALIVSYFWFQAISKKELIAQIKLSNYMNFIFFLIVSMVGIFVAYTSKIIFPQNIQVYINDAIGFSLPIMYFIFIISILAIILTKKEKILKVFALHILLMLGLIFVICDSGLPYYTSFAQDELEEYANIVYQQNNSKLITYGFSAKYSILNPSKKIKYIIGSNKDDFNELKSYIINNKENIFILTRIKINDLEDKKEFKKIKEGKVYRLYYSNIN